MKGFKRMAVAAALVLAFSVPMVAQAAGVVNKGAGPIGTPGSDKTIKAHVLALEIAVAALQKTVATQAAQIATLQGQVATLQANPAIDLGNNNLVIDHSAVSADGLNGPNIFFKGANIHIVSGSGATGAINGLGNLLVGYDESPAVPSRGGSHNLVVGPGHNFSSFGGLVGGSDNTVSGADASVTGGRNNTASGNTSVVVGGNGNSATATDSIKP